MRHEWSRNDKKGGQKCRCPWHQTKCDDSINQHKQRPYHQIHHKSYRVSESRILQFREDELAKQYHRTGKYRYRKRIRQGNQSQQDSSQTGKQRFLDRCRFCIDAFFLTQFAGFLTKFEGRRASLQSFWALQRGLRSNILMKPDSFGRASDRRESKPCFQVLAISFQAFFVISETRVSSPRTT